jgi:putative intracellular protease/amidase
MKISRIFQILALVVLTVASIQAFAQQHKPRVLIIVTSADKFPDGKPTGMWLEEYAVPYQIMLQQGYELTVVSPKGGVAPVDPRSAAKGDQETQWADALKARGATIKLTKAIQAKDFDAVFIPGGHGPLFDLATNSQSIQLISDFARAGKPVASVCHGPAALVGVTLANGDPFVNGKKLTSFSDAEEKAADAQLMPPFSVQQKLVELGAIYSQGANFAEYTMVDGNLITGQNPTSSRKVAQLLLEAIAARDAKGTAQKGQ